MGLFTSLSFTTEASTSVASNVWFKSCKIPWRRHLDERGKLSPFPGFWTGWDWPLTRHARGVHECSCHFATKARHFPHHLFHNGNSNVWDHFVHVSASPVFWHQACITEFRGESLIASLQCDSIASYKGPCLSAIISQGCSSTAKRMPLPALSICLRLSCPLGNELVLLQCKFKRLQSADLFTVPDRS